MGALRTRVQALEQNPPLLPMAYRSGFYYSPPYVASANVALTQNKLYARPFYVQKDTTFRTIGVVTTGTALAQVELGIYADGGGFPTTLLIDAGAVSTATAGFKSININTVIPKGWCWLACAVQGAAGNINSVNTASFNFGNVGTSDPFSTGPIQGYSQTGISGVLPSPWGATLTEENTTLPIVWVQAP